MESGAVAAATALLAIAAATREALLTPSGRYVGACGAKRGKK